MGDLQFVLDCHARDSPSRPRLTLYFAGGGPYGETRLMRKWRSVALRGGKAHWRQGPLRFRNGQQNYRQYRAVAYSYLSGGRRANMP